MSLEIVNLSSNTVPKIEESQMNDWISFGENDEYFGYLKNRYLYSPTNNAVINNVAKLIVGSGLNSKDKAIKPNEWARITSQVNNEMLSKIALDLKLYGQAAFQVLKGKSIDYLDVTTLRFQKKDKDGNFKGWYFSPNWEDRRIKPTLIPKFEKGKAEVEIIYLSLYTPQSIYNSLPDYVGGLVYCELEEEIADYLLNDTKNGFSGKTIISMFGPIPDEQKRAHISNQIKKKLTGTKGQTVIVDFTEDPAFKTAVDTVPLNDAPKHYEYLSKEAQGQILKAHNVTTPRIFGISSENGLSSNADELKNSWNLYMTSVVSTYQDIIVKGLIEYFQSISIYFDYTNPFGQAEKFNGAQLTNIKETIINFNRGEMTKDQARAYLISIVGISELEVNKIFPKDETPQLSAQSWDDEAFSSIDKFGETMEGWELVSEHEVDYDNDDEMNAELDKSFAPNFTEKLARLIPNFNNSKGSEDGVTEDGKRYKIRYAYKGGLNPNSREFCKKVIASGKVWKKEDIIKMGSIPVNEGFGVGGSDTYSIWLHKGGARCSHKWVRQIYLAEGTNVDVNSPTARVIDTFTAQAMGVQTKPIGQEVVAPKDMPYKGYTEAYYKKHFAK